MTEKSDQIKDPVCGMWVDKKELTIVYQQMHFAFCSLQCKSRFLAKPHLYIGYPNGEKAPKQEGQKAIKRHRMRLNKSLSHDQIVLVMEAMQSMMGIKDIDVQPETIEIEYDLLQVTFQQLEGKLAEIGIQLGGDWGERLRRSLIHESEEWQIDCMEVTPHKHFHT